MANGLNIVAGTPGQILKHNGANTIPTFTSSFGSLRLLQTYTANASASIDMTSVMDTSLYYAYRIIVRNAYLNAGGVNLRSKVSTDNGATWKVGASDYAYVRCSHSTGATPILSATGDDTITMALYGVPGATDSPVSLILEVMAIASYRLNAIGIWQQGNGAITPLSWEYRTDTTCNAIQFLGTSGTITAGTFEIYGYMK